MKVSKRKTVNYCRGCTYLVDDGLYCEFLAVRLLSKFHPCKWFTVKKVRNDNK